MNKRITILGIILLLLFKINLVSANILGDINGDGVVGLHEALFALQIASGQHPNFPDTCVLTGAGIWESGQDYIECDAVSHVGNFYVALVSNTSVTGNAPDIDAVIWTLLPLKGEKGDAGPQGPVGPPGADGITSETDPTVPGSIKDGISWSEISIRPAGLDDGDDIGITSEIDPTVPASIKDGVSWGELSNIPVDFSDGVDNDAGGDITAVTAGTGLSGGAETGDASLEVVVPLELIGNTSSALNAIIKGQNNGNGYGIYGMASLNNGVYGYSYSSNGVLGFSGDKSGVTGLNGSMGNEGRLGTENYGVYGKSNNGYSGYFDGDTKVTGGLHVDANAQISGDLLLANNLGIGLENPTLPLYIRQTVTGLTYPLKVENKASGDASGESDVGILFSAGGSGTEERGKGALVYEATSTWNRGSFHFLQDNIANSSNPDIADSVMSITNSGRVGIGADPQTLLHVSSDTSGDATLLLEADTDNNNEGDQPSIEMRQDGGLVSAKIGFVDGLNNLTIASSEKIELHVKDHGNFEKNVITVGQEWVDHSGIDVATGKVDIDGDLYIDGNVNLSGKLGWETRTGYYTVPPAAFQPRTDKGYVNNGSYLYGDDLLGGSYSFVAAVNMPHNAVVTKLSFYFFDTSDANGTLSLKRQRLSDGIYVNLASLLGSGNANGLRSLSTTGISDATIINSEYSYYLYLTLPDRNIWLANVKIEYSYSGSY